MQCCAAMLIVTHCTFADSTMVTLMATNASKKNGDYEMCSTGCKNNANNKLPCLLQLIIPAVVVTSLCVIMTITFALAICLFNG